MFPEWSALRTRLIADELDKTLRRAKITLGQTSQSLCRWLRSTRRNEPDTRPFKSLERHATDQKYAAMWKQFLYYCFRTFQLDPTRREMHYGIGFTAEQLRCMAEVEEMLDGVLAEREYEEWETSRFELEEHDMSSEDDDEDEEEEEEENNEDDDSEGQQEGDRYRHADVHGDKRRVPPQRRSSGKQKSINGKDGTGSTDLEEHLTEKIFELCIKFLTQVFRNGEDETRSPLIHFCGVLGIDWKLGRFREAGSYTPYLAGMVWIGRLLLLEYALPSGRYEASGWPARDYYGDHGWRLEEVRWEWMLEGSRSPLDNMISLMAYGKYVAKVTGRAGVITWDEDGLGLQIKDKHMTIEGFKLMSHGVIKEAKDVLDTELLFGCGQMTLDLANMRDVMSERKKGFCLIDDERNRLGGGLRDMLSLVKLASPEKTLLDGRQQWRRDRVIGYLERKKRFLELLMAAMHLTGGQPGRGSEIGSIKFRNSMMSSRNLFMHRGDLFYVTEYHKARSATNLSHVVARFLPQPVAEMPLVFIAFIRPFTVMIYNQVSALQTTDMDGNYLFSDESTPNKCWEGKTLSGVMTQMSMKYLHEKINIWGYRHLTVAITRKYISDISGFFGGRDDEWERQYERDRGKDVYARQTGHLRSTNTAIYGLDTAYPSQLQPELLDEYRRISPRWYQWLGFIGREESVIRTGLGTLEEDIGGGVLGKRTREESESRDEPIRGEDELMSPESQQLKRMLNDMARLMALRREQKKLREKLGLQ